MNILITGAKGFLGSNLTVNLKNIRDGKNRTRPNLKIGEIYEYSRENTEEELEEWCKNADFVFHFAGLNRTDDLSSFVTDNCNLTDRILEILKENGNSCPVLFSSSVYAGMVHQIGLDPYGETKWLAESAMLTHHVAAGAPVYIYRFPHIIGKWSRPEYNSVTATFCYRIARGLPIEVIEPEKEIELLFIDDFLEEMYDALEGHPHKALDLGDLMEEETALDLQYRVPVTHWTSIGRIAEILIGFHNCKDAVPALRMKPGSLEKKLYSMYVSYLPEAKAAKDLEMITDQRGSFLELLRTKNHGQFSLNIIAPGAEKGQHWHNSKWEMFIVVSGRGLIRQRRIGTDEVTEYKVSGEKIRAVHMLPGHTHSIRNLSKDEPLTVLMWANEAFDSGRPDTFTEEV